MSSPSSAVALSAEVDRDSAPTSALPFPLLLVLFVASGAAGLIDQVCFSKYLGYIVGATAYAVSAVLAAFMTGLALGAHFSGRATTRVARPLVVYGVLELVVAGAVALSPAAFHALTPLYVGLAHLAPHSLVALSVFRWLVAALLVVAPTIAMGATLPMLARAIAIDDRMTRRAASGHAGSSERRLGALYAANTLGGAAGALVTVYAILPALGLSKTLWLAATVSALVGAVALRQGRRLIADPNDNGDSSDGSNVKDSDASSGDAAEFPDRAEHGVLLGLALISGWLVFALEVISTHLLALIIGNSAYAFGLILAAVLCWLFVGASIAPRVHARYGDPALAGGLALTGLAVAATLLLWDWIPLMFATSGKTFTTFASREAMRGVAAFAILMFQVTLMGLTFPLVLQRIARYRRVGFLVGQMTAVNTLGAVAGALVTGYWMLPRLGSQGSLIAIAVVYALAGVATLAATRVPRRTPTLVLAGSALVLVIAAPRWDLLRLTSGTNVYFDGHDNPEQILFIREDVHGGVTSVTRNALGVKTLFTNGKFQGNTGWEMKAQRFFAHYPSIFVHDFDSALVIGLGTGTTLGTLAGYPWKTIDVVEISPSIVDAADRYFQEPNRGAIHDPRVTIHLDDGRNHLLVQSGQYDLISMELSSIWFAGAANLYSDEYYELALRHLKPNGIFQQWVQLHHIYERDFATVLHTLRRHFAHVALFYGGGQGIIVASQQPFVTSRAHLAELQSLPRVSDVIPYSRPLPNLLDDLLLLDDGLDRYIAGVAQRVHRNIGELVSTDDNIYLEYATPKGNILPWSNRELLVAKLKHYRDEAAVTRLLVEN